MAVVVRLMGGLGNQMFQYAAGRRLAIRHGAELVLDLGWFRYEAAKWPTPRPFALDRFPLAYRRIELRPRMSYIWERGKRGLSFRRPPLVLRQAAWDGRVDRRVLEAPDDVLLVGHWQSELYFAEISDVIRREFIFPECPDAQVSPVAAVSEALVAVHIRRGDYVANPVTNEFHGVLSRNYYERALSLVTERVANARFLAFSDDPDWVEQELAPTLPLTVCRGADALDDLRMMTNCRHHVIANSSFSWWGAWLGEAPESVIVAPTAWFANPDIDTTDFVPDRWNRI